MEYRRSKNESEDHRDVRVNADPADGKERRMPSTRFGNLRGRLGDRETWNDKGWRAYCFFPSST
jgi:hypothetical protein